MLDVIALNSYVVTSYDLVADNLTNNLVGERKLVYGCLERFWLFSQGFSVGIVFQMPMVKSNRSYRIQA